jgi:uncharacterized protein
MYSLTTHSAIADDPAGSVEPLGRGRQSLSAPRVSPRHGAHGCVGESLGWVPQHLALRDARGDLVAAAPCYLKFNSYGEFVFDWSWADAYRRKGLRYYPKLVIASPYTPATGPRLLTGDSPARERMHAP